MGTSQSLLLLGRIATLLIMILMGFISVKTGRLKSEDSRVLSNLSFEWIIPCSLISAFQTEYAADKAASFLFACGAAAFSILLYMLAARLLRRPLKLNCAEEGSMIFSNSAGVGAPLCAGVFGSGSLFFVAAHMGLQNLAIMLTLPLMMNRGAKADLKKLLLNRNIISIVIGLGLFFSGIKLPEVLSSAISTVGGMLSPVSMFMIGMLVGTADFKAILRDKRTYFVTFARLLAFPLLYTVLVRISGICGTVFYARDVCKYILVASSAPCAALVMQMSSLYRPEKEAQEAGTLNIASSLLCVVTMPLVLALYEWIV